MQHAVHTHFLETPFGNLTYKVSAPDAEEPPQSRDHGARRVYFTPVGDTPGHQAIAPLTGPFTADSTHTPETAEYDPDRRNSFLRTRRPITINNRQYRETFTATRRKDGTYTLHSMFGDTFTDSAYQKLTKWLNEHDSDILSPNVLAQSEYDEAYNRHAWAVEDHAKATKAQHEAALAEDAAWGTLRTLTNPAVEN